MREFIECLQCGFVTYASDPTIPKPKTGEACPDCGSTDFQFTE